MILTVQHLKQGALALAVAAAVGSLALVAAGPASSQDAAKPAADSKDSKAAPTKAKPALSVSVVQPQSAELPLRISANGNVAAWQEAVLGAEANGLRLASVSVNVGDRVRRGQVLATFAAETVAAELAQAKASLAEAEASLADAKANAERARSIQASGALSAQQVTQLLTGEKTAEARVALAKAQMAAAEVRLKQAQVVAPDAGTISARSATVGAVAQQGQELFRLIRNDRLEWRAEVTSSEIAKVKAGQAVGVVSATGAKTEGRVRMVAPTVDPQTRNALVYVDLPASAGQSGAFKAGMFARGDFVLGASAALTVPQTALSLRDGFSYVFTVGPDNKASQVKVQVGRRLGDKVEVSGIKAADRVVASGSAFLSDGDFVKVVAP